MEQTRGPQPNRSAFPATAGLAVEDHGRAVTANQRAAAWYRQAQRAIDCRLAAAALRLALIADPAFGLALVDLLALNGASSQHLSCGQMNWERHHIEVVRAAASGDAVRAADLLREHLANVGCDPLAHRIVAHLRRSTGVTADRPPSCHPTVWNAVHDR
jgi:hypothetical protein